jgi:hypothetical protein
MLEAGRFSSLLEGMVTKWIDFVVSRRYKLASERSGEVEGQPSRKIHLYRPHVSELLQKEGENEKVSLCRSFGPCALFLVRLPKTTWDRLGLGSQGY